ncbi:MAG: PIG-L family deacetylase [Thermodesulfobacteriota bacterium]
MTFSVAAWREYAANMARLLADGPVQSFGEDPAVDLVPTTGHAAGGRVVLCSPHPDDEAIVGLLPLRLRQEADCRVINLLFTLGSDRTRRGERCREAAASSRLSGFEVLLAAEPEGLDRLSLRELREDRPRFESMVDLVASRLTDLRPDLVVYPHPHDGHPTHEAVAAIVTEALRRRAQAGAAAILAVQTECWRQLQQPNLLVGAGAGDVGRLCAAIAAHAGEVARHPYHRRQPVRMLENAFRGSELVRGFGSGGESPLFGELYRLGIFDGAGFAAAAAAMLPASTRISLGSLRALAGR